MAQPLCVLQIVAPARTGGLEQVVHQLAAGLRHRGHDVHVAVVLAQDEGEHPLFAPLRTAGVVVHPLPLPPRAYWREGAATASLCRQLNPAVVHTHGYRPDVVDAGVARRHRIPIVTTIHGFTGGGWKNRLYERLQRLAWRRFDAVAAVSPALARQVACDGVRRERIHLVPNAWRATTPTLECAAARYKLGISDDRFHIGWVGRLQREKGPDIMVDALAYLVDLPVVVSMIGAGREGAGLQERAKTLGVADRVIWHGAVLEAAGLFRAFDAFVLSSRTEGMPMVLFEAMAARVPIVATCVGGVLDVVSDAQALLVPAGDPAALAAGIRSVYLDAGAAVGRAAAARARVERDFAVDRWLAAYEDVYANVCRRARLDGEGAR